MLAVIDIIFGAVIALFILGALVDDPQGFKALEPVDQVLVLLIIVCGLLLMGSGVVILELM